jgi:uncharacterized protein YndB with AHSA1/START domain
MINRVDQISRVLILPASPEEVFRRSFGSPEAISSWFAETVTGDFEVGGTIALIWGKHRCECRVTALEPGVCFEYQWHPGEACALHAFPEGELTTVRFELYPHPEGTELRLVETGFERIPYARRGTTFGENSNGWDEELAKLLR